MTISTRRLVQIAAWGGVVVASTGIYLQTKLVDRIRSYDYYKDAMRRLRTHPGAVAYLGEPIKDRRFKLSDTENNFSDGKTARFRIPLIFYYMEGIVKMNFEGTAKERFFYHNTLLCLIKSLQDNNITVDLRNDSYVCGQLVTVDGFMNLSFDKAVYCDTQQNEYFFDNLFIQARNIRYVHIPESMTILGNITNELKRKKNQKPRVKSRKATKALIQHMKTVAELDN